ncbi:Uncharacterized protein (Fragment) OS=uncultured bacterium PE=4 SV=1 [Gemmata massiliana]|uniref:SMI1/KNR4 family protein n=1 Tax=Gemmata massiliana TaxID=1210884 RepID=A0A6P2CZM5_9BACT
MTEAEWLACEDPEKLVNRAHRKKNLLTDRKFRLFAVACARAVWPRIASDNGRTAVEVAERYADDSATSHEVAVVLAAAIPSGGDEDSDDETSDDYKAGHALSAAVCTCFERKHFLYAATSAATAASDPQRARAGQCVMLRDIVGNPFRPAAFSPSWRTSTAITLAAQMYESRDFGAMPILADALQDAGCDNADVLDHCRSDGPHVRGCWVVDLVLGKE